VLTRGPRAACGLLTAAAAEQSTWECAAGWYGMVSDNDGVLINVSIITNTWGGVHNSYLAGTVAEVQGD